MWCLSRRRSVGLTTHGRIQAPLAAAFDISTDSRPAAGIEVEGSCAGREGWLSR